MKILSLLVITILSVGLVSAGYQVMPEPEPRFGEAIEFDREPPPFPHPEPEPEPEPNPTPTVTYSGGSGGKRMVLTASMDRCMINQQSKIQPYMDNKDVEGVVRHLELRHYECLKYVWARAKHQILHVW